MNKRNHIDLKPHIDSLCAFFGTTKEELMNRPRNGNKPDVIKRAVFYYLYYKVGGTYKMIAKEFGVSHANISIMLQKSLDNTPEHLSILTDIDNYLKCG
jgi:hypothetical protein